MQYHKVEGTAARYCKVVSFNFFEATEVDVPAGYTLHQLSAARAPETFPRVERTIDTRAGGVRFEHYETILRVPLLPVGTDIYQDGGLMGAFWAGGTLRAAVPLEGESRYKGWMQSWANDSCSVPLGSRGENTIQITAPIPFDMCATRGEGMEVYVSETPIQQSYFERGFGEFGTEATCRPGNNGNTGFRSPVRKLTLPDPLVVNVPIEPR